MQIDVDHELVQQSDQIRDYVFPLCLTDRDKLTSLLGTAFVIGNRGYALTSGHCIPRDATGLSAIFAVGELNEWHSITVGQIERHPTVDVALLRLGGSGWRSIFTLSNIAHGSTLQYRMFGYPEDTYQEVIENGYAKTRPDLVYVEGYIRRRLTNIQLDSIRGSSFFELSEIAGGGCSGSPLFTRHTASQWEVVGIYAGERRTKGFAEVGYAVRVADLGDWKPKILGDSIFEEAART